MLEVLLREGLTDCVLVVTRFFGGILLGTGGLARAYSHCAKLAVNAGGIAEMRLCDSAEIECDYGLYGRIAALIPEQGGVIHDTGFTDIVEIKFTMPRGLMEPLQAKLTEMSAGSLNIRITGEMYTAFTVSES
ncbi:hypothetical protein SDC9_192343 [bioreactor metagenome]|uniref:IMPACT family member YigZ n=1 Tax=bioreactor metagenome TaxID=1076179 RepID=A0A645I0K1_9ZZZZ